MWEHLRIATGGGKVGQVFSMSAEQPVIKDSRIEKGLLKRLQFSEILLREMITMFSVQVRINRHVSEGPWKALFCCFRSKSSYDPITVQRI